MSLPAVSAEAGNLEKAVSRVGKCKNFGRGLPPAPSLSAKCGPRIRIRMRPAKAPPPRHEVSEPPTAGPGLGSSERVRKPRPTSRVSSVSRRRTTGRSGEPFSDSRVGRITQRQGPFQQGGRRPLCGAGIHSPPRMRECSARAIRDIPTEFTKYLKQRKPLIKKKFRFRMADLEISPWERLNPFWDGV